MSHDWRIVEALRMIQEGCWTVRGAAKFAGLTYHEVLDEMAKAGVDSGPTLEELREALDHPLTSLQFRSRVRQ